MIEAVRIFDHYQFRVAQTKAKDARKKLQLTKPPVKASEKPWWQEYYAHGRKQLDRLLFA